LTAAFAKLLEETGGEGAQVLHVGIDRRNVHYYTERVLTRLRATGEIEFHELFDRSEGRYGLVGTLVAVLELMKQGFVHARQDSIAAPIWLLYRGPTDLTAEQVAARE
jgi:chromatin segregation and condensation protein Rec8/ScpA/Scc1 (kleisin family)